MDNINLLNQIQDIIISADSIINNDREKCMNGAIGRLDDIFTIVNEKFYDVVIEEYSVCEQNLIKWQALENILFSTYYRMNKLDAIVKIYNEIMNVSIQSFITDEKYFNQSIIKKDLAIKGRANIKFGAEVLNILLNNTMIIICKFLCDINIFEPNKEVDIIIQNILLQKYLNKDNYGKLITRNL